MNSYRHSDGFSLIEVLASSVVLSLAAVGITAAWRLADYKALLARLDHRADRILREYCELQTFAPSSVKPFMIGVPEAVAPQDPLTGFLYHPLKLNSPKEAPLYDDVIDYSVGYSSATGELTLIYTVPGYGSDVAKSFSKTVTLNH
jgi:prepilin-type N-terminal cleavage/methylation domain-containing protein